MVRSGSRPAGALHLPQPERPGKYDVGHPFKWINGYIGRITTAGVITKYSFAPGVAPGSNGAQRNSRQLHKTSRRGQTARAVVHRLGHQQYGEVHACEHRGVHRPPHHLRARVVVLQPRDQRSDGPYIRSRRCSVVYQLQLPVPRFDLQFHRPDDHVWSGDDVRGTGHRPTRLTSQLVLTAPCGLSVEGITPSAGSLLRKGIQKPRSSNTVVPHVTDTQLVIETVWVRVRRADPHMLTYQRPVPASAVARLSQRPGKVTPCPGPSDQEPPGSVRFEFEEALGLLAALEDARDALIEHRPFG